MSLIEGPSVPGQRRRKRSTKRQLRSMLVIGETAVEIRGKGAHEYRTAGGPGAMVAVALSALGHQVTLLTSIAPDEDGMRIVHHVLDADVALQPISFSATTTPTRLLAGESSPGIRPPGAEWRLPPPHLICNADAVHLSSFFALSPAGRKSLIDVAASAKEKGALVSFAPDLDTRALCDRGDDRRRFEDLLEFTSVVMLSEEEAQWVYPGLTASEAAQRVLGLGPKMVSVRGHTGTVLLATVKNQCMGYAANEADHIVGLLDHALRSGRVRARDQIAVARLATTQDTELTCWKIIDRGTR